MSRVTALLILMTAVCFDTEASVIKTRPGDVRGTEANGIHMFRGIPFAKSPVGELRWQAPLPVETHAGVLDAGDFGPVCLQSTRPGQAVPDMSEDCLTLNVWADRSGGESGQKQPVMVRIPG